MSEEDNTTNRENLPFAYAEVVRLMRDELDDDKVIRERVKVEMNRFLGRILKNVCRQLNEYPYTTIDHGMFRECIYPYAQIERINEERECIIARLEAIKRDCDILIIDAQHTMRANEGDGH